MQTCEFFVNALNVGLREQHVKALLFYDPEVMVQSFYVLPRVLPDVYVTVRLIENGPPDSVKLYLGGFCFDPQRSDYYKGIQLPRWSQLEGGRDTGPMETDKANAASRIAKEFAAYWVQTVREMGGHALAEKPQPEPSPHHSATVEQPPLPANEQPDQHREDLVLHMAVTERTWVVVDADGGTVLQKVLNPGEAEDFKAHDHFDVTVGNASGITLTLNGKPLKSLGRRGEVKSVHLTHDSLK
jgi:hypothetical protein